MANCCKNYLTVRVPLNDNDVVKVNLKELDRFKQTASAGKNPLETNKFVRYPKKFRMLDKAAKRVKRRFGKDITSGYSQGGYKWRCENWGTKLGICDAVVLEENMEQDPFIKYGFFTASLPPVPVIIKMSEMFPSLCFELFYNEYLNDRCGRLICVSGNLWWIEGGFD